MTDGRCVGTAIRSTQKAEPAFSSSVSNAATSNMELSAVGVIPHQQFA